MEPRQQLEQRAILIMGIIQQLMTTRSQKLFKALPVSNSEFSLLSHLSHNPTRSWTISELADVMEMNQPGITKVVAKLTEKAVLNVEVDKFDKRKRHISINDKGLKLTRDIQIKLQPEISRCLDVLDEEELKLMVKLNEKFMTWLDENRLA